MFLVRTWNLQLSTRRFQVRVVTESTWMTNLTFSFLALNPLSAFCEHPPVPTELARCLLMFYKKKKSWWADPKNIAKRGEKIRHGLNSLKDEFKKNITELLWFSSLK